MKRNKGARQVSYVDAKDAVRACRAGTDEKGGG